MMSAVNGVVFQAINARKDTKLESAAQMYETIPTWYRAPNVKYTKGMMLNTDKNVQFDIAFEFWGSIERHAGELKDIAIQNEGFPQDSGIKMLYLGGVWNHALMELPLNDNFIVDSKTIHTFAVQKTRRIKNTVGVVPCDNWVFGQEIKLTTDIVGHNEVWLTKDDVAQAESIDLVEHSFEYPDYRIPKMKTCPYQWYNVVCTETRILDPDSLRDSQWPTFEKLYEKFKVSVPNPAPSPGFLKLYTKMVTEE